MIAEAHHAGLYEIGTIEHVRLEDDFIVRHVTFIPVEERDGVMDPVVVILPGGTVDADTVAGAEVQTGDRVFALLRDTPLDGLLNLYGGHHYSMWYPAEEDGVQGLRTAEGWMVTEVPCDERPIVRRSATMEVGDSVMFAATDDEQALAEEQLRETTGAAAPLLARTTALDAFVACMRGAR